MIVEMMHHLKSRRGKLEVFLDIPIVSHWVKKDVGEVKKISVFGDILKLAETNDVMITRTDDKKKLVVFIDEPGMKFRIRG